MKRYLFLILVFAFVLLTACSASKVTNPAVSAAPTQQKGQQTQLASASASSGMIEPEMLLSQEEAGKITGDTYSKTEKKEQKAVGQKLNIYKSSDDSNYFQITVTQQAFMPQNQQTPEQLFKSIVGAMTKAKKIEGLGSEAYLSSPLLHVLDKGYYLTFASDCPDEKLIEAAKATVQKLETLTK